MPVEAGRLKPIYAVLVLETILIAVVFRDLDLPVILAASL